MISIIIPAHNEAAVIGRSLETLLAGTAPGELEIAVVCNACSDDTVDIARRFPVRVLETDVPGKANALNLGDAVVRAFPRIYLDADVIITADTARSLAGSLAKGEVLAVAPTPRIDVDGCSIPVRAYYMIRSRLPSSRQGIGGSGVYALSSAGRSRFAKFPAITADDAFVRLQFSPGERATLPTVTSTVYAPRTLKSLTAIRTRVYYGTDELARRFPAMMANADASNNRALMRLLKRPTMWPAIAIYFGVNAAARCLAKARAYRKSPKWTHDQSSRLRRA
ncbi:glycosyltransferase [Bradyrhizobium genosp. L]|uniref:glycosyltransferase n=1 Tax=Bradyrhizobium genosp. L TaxID=83637 RepID=UPI0018A32187|nr:glycosyltransferase [Bradyrhizobium genosp. L]QPF86547.1 glycosyltransferase [Bradyrhizobium genosp. L]